MRRGHGFALALAGLLGTSALAAAQGGALTVGGTTARSGVHNLRAGFTPAPFELATTAGGPLHVAPMRLGAGCRGYTQASPNAIVRFAGASTFLRFFARSASNVTLLVRDPNGRFLCNDDTVPGRNENPMVDVYQPRPGNYEIWVGTSAAGPETRATLFVTESRDQRP